MKLLVVFALTLAYTSASVLHGFNSSVVDTNVGIIHGHSAEPGQFPYQVQLLLPGGPQCGGSLISHRWVLTAASCTEHFDNITVHLGGIRRSAPRKTYIVSKKDIIIHENFNSDTLSADISLIRIPYVKYSRYIKAVKLPKIKISYPSYAGFNASISGWGRTSFESTHEPEILQYAKVGIISIKDCKKMFGKLGKYIWPSLICASIVSAETWEGDTGIPLVELRSSVQIGISSVDSPKPELEYPAIFTRVTSYLKWIKRHTKLPL
ncbi:serine protease 1-like [Drosophila sulfurigaster albostrigata]|uniref:serine protease 1-like n=1 Tax=Drosophila sulfurigaster albostrigata TaxID=89887 RepID=UPI002D2185FA|nr:serine protease 1-like [Drosophila sulfurigaster albostrigata]